MSILWLNRAAQSLAEALRLVASKKLDVEFSELVTGYHLRTGSEASYVDIYLYDSLSSGAGYAVSVADANKFAPVLFHFILTRLPAVRRKVLTMGADHPESPAFSMLHRLKEPCRNGHEYGILLHGWRILL